MNIEQQEQLQKHIRGIAKILHAEADPGEIKTLEGIEKTVRQLAQEHVMPELGIFLSKQNQEQKAEKVEQ